MQTKILPHAGGVLFNKKKKIPIKFVKNFIDEILEDFFFITLSIILFIKIRFQLSLSQQMGFK